jgi:uncharacterized OB-fold protein
VTIHRADLSEPDTFTRPYWDAAAADKPRLLLRRYRACGHAHHYPREFCPHCWSEDVHWEATSSRTTLYTWPLVHANDLPPFLERLPYNAAVAELMEGPRLMTTLVDCEPTQLQAGMKLFVDFVAFAVVGDEPAPRIPASRPARDPGGATERRL